MFFVLSGFLITRILLKSRGTEHFYRNFYIRRFLRIFPLYYLFLFIFFYLIPKFSRLSELYPTDLTNFRWYLSFCSNLLFSKLGFNHGSVVDVTWSLSIEEQFYLFWPLLVRNLSLKQLRWTCLSLYGLSQALILARYFSHGSLSSTYFFTLTRWDGILLGSLLASSILEPKVSTLLTKYGKSILAVSLFLSLTAFVKGIHTTSPLIQILGFPSFALFFSSLLAQLNSPGVLHKCFSIEPLRVLGKYSYGLYLFHKPTIIALEKALFPYLDTLFFAQWPDFRMFLFQIISVLASLLVAMILFHFYENHFLKLKDRFN